MLTRKQRKKIPDFTQRVNMWKNYAASNSLAAHEQTLFVGDVPKDMGGLSAVEAIYLYESTGRVEACYEVDQANHILWCKAACDVQIKQWAEGLVEGTLLLSELWDVPYELSSAADNLRWKIMRR